MKCKTRYKLASLIIDHTPWTHKLMLLRIVSIIIWCRCDHLSMWKQLFGHRMKGKLWATWKFRRYCIHSHRKVAITSTCIYNYTHPLKYEKIVLHRLIHSWSHHPPVLETKNTSSSVTPVARWFTVSCNSPLSPSIFSHIAAIPGCTEDEAGIDCLRMRHHVFPRNWGLRITSYNYGQ